MHDFIIVLLEFMIFIFHKQKYFLIVHSHFNNAKSHCKNKGQAVALTALEILFFVIIFVLCSVGNVETQ